MRNNGYVDIIGWVGGGSKIEIYDLVNCEVDRCSNLPLITNNRVSCFVRQ